MNRNYKEALLKNPDQSDWEIIVEPVEDGG